MEGAAAAGQVATVLADMPWSDVGDFHSLGESLPTDESGNLVIGDASRVLARDVKDAVIVSTTDRIVAAIGLENMIIVDTLMRCWSAPRPRAGGQADRGRAPRRRAGNCI